MPSPNLTPFAGQRYLNLESFKRDGTPVQTPVWFAEEEGVLYVYTLANAWKVKRIRRNSHIRIAPCTMHGTVIGPWVKAAATIMDATTAAHGHALLRHKYGWMKGIGDLFSRLLHRERVVIAMRLLAGRAALIIAKGNGGSGLRLDSDHPCHSSMIRPHVSERPL